MPRRAARTVWALAVVACTAWCVHAAPAAGVFDVTRYGAVGDGVTLDTAAVRSAAAGVAKAGGGVLLFPTVHSRGTTFLTGPFNLSSNVVLQLQPGVTIAGSPHGDDWPLVDPAVVWPQFSHGSDCAPGEESCRLMHQALVFAFNATNVTVTTAGSGGVAGLPGVVDGRGAAWWACHKDLRSAPCNGYSRPHLVMFSSVEGAVLANTTFQNSPDWSLHMASVTHLHVTGVSVLAPESSPNTDGIDVDCTQHALIENSYFSVGDDIVAVKSGIDYFGRLYNRSSAHVLVRNITGGTGHGLSIGSETSGGVHNVTFTDIQLLNTQRGPRMKSQRGRGGVVSDITFRNIVAHGVSEKISVTLDYSHGIPPTNASATPVFQNVVFEDLVFYGGDNDAGILVGLPESQLSNFTIRNVTVSDVKDLAWKQCTDVADSSCSDSTLCPPCV